MSAAAPFVAEGGCDCRRVRYRMESRPLFVHCCHCRWCQRESGEGQVMWVVIPPGAPALPEYYEREKHWPAESLARRLNLLPRIEEYQARRVSAAR